MKFTAKTGHREQEYRSSTLRTENHPGELFDEIDPRQVELACKTVSSFDDQHSNSMGIGDDNQIGHSFNFRSSYVPGKSKGEKILSGRPSTSQREIGKRINDLLQTQDSAHLNTEQQEPGREIYIPGKCEKSQ